LQEAGATPVQELSYSLATAIAVLDAVRSGGQVKADELPKVVGRISFFVNAGMRFIEEMCKMRAFTALWDGITRDRYGVADASMRRFRYGVQVNSLGLTEPQPENNILRIVLEMLGVTLSKDARCRALQLPAWNEALGLPRPWDQQWSLRAQQILAFESDLLEYDDIFHGSHVIEAKVKAMVEASLKEIADIEARGGVIEAVESGYLKQRLVESNAARLRAIESGEQIVVGVNKFIETAPCPLTADLDEAIMVVDPAVENAAIAAIKKWRNARDAKAVSDALAKLRDAVRNGENIMPPSIEAARAGVTTGEWAEALRKVMGEYRAPTGVSGARVDQPQGAAGQDNVLELRARMNELERELGRRPKMLVGKPGLDGHSNGAEQIALKARDVGFEVVYEGIRVTPEQIVASALEEGVHLIGLSILSGSHLALVPQVLQKLRVAGLHHVPLVVGGIIPEADARALEKEGVARVYTPKDFALNNIMSDLVELVAGSVHPHAAE
jgi:(2R)-ethylmalonyl-CoA mutase